MVEKIITKRAKILRCNQTDAEQRIWYYLRAHRYDHWKFKRQKPIGRYIVDFVCMSLKLIIEVDGGQHAEALHYDTKRTRWLESQGFYVLRFWNHEVLCETESVFNAIHHKIIALFPSPSPASRRGEQKVMQPKGFSLLELLITLTLFSILIAIAYPNYQQYLQRAHRQQAALGLMQLSAELTRYHFKHHTYESVVLTDLNVPNLLEDHYEMTIDRQTQNTYIISAVPRFTDTQCGILSLDQLHEKSVSGAGSVSLCW